MFSCRQNAFLLSPDSRQERTTCSICSSVCFMITVFHKEIHKLPSCIDVLARVLTVKHSQSWYLIQCIESITPCLYISFSSSFASISIHLQGQHQIGK